MYVSLHLSSRFHLSCFRVLSLERILNHTLLYFMQSMSYYELDIYIQRNQSENAIKWNLSHAKCGNSAIFTLLHCKEPLTKKQFRAMGVLLLINLLGNIIVKKNKLWRKFKKNQMMTIIEHVLLRYYDVLLENLPRTKDRDMSFC